MRKSMKILFTASVLLNVVLLGVGGGMAYKHWAEHPWQKLKRDLAPETRNVIARNFRATHKQIKPLAEQAHQGREKLMEIIQAEEFDGAAFDDAVSEMQENQEKVMDIKIDTMKKIAAELPAEERAKMAKKFVSALDRERKYYKNRDHKWKHPDAPKDGEDKEGVN